MGTLMHERGTLGRRDSGDVPAQHGTLIELAKKTERNGGKAADDPVVRQKLAQCYAEIEIMRWNQGRAFSRIS